RSRGARRRTSAGRSRFPAGDRRRRSSGAIACSCSRRGRAGGGARGATHPPAGARRAGSPASAVPPTVPQTDRPLGERTAREQRPHEASHQENGTYASSSAITDGRRIYAWFESQGMYVYDMDGTLLWQKDLGDKLMRNQFGEGSTPVLHRDRLMIVW